MISASEAAALFVPQPFTEQEIEEQIRRTAKSRNWTCFDQHRLTDDQRARLASVGYKVQLTGTDYMVEWPAPPQDSI